MVKGDLLTLPFPPQFANEESCQASSWSRRTEEQEAFNPASNFGPANALQPPCKHCTIRDHVTFSKLTHSHVFVWCWYPKIIHCVTFPRMTHVSLTLPGGGLLAIGYPTSHGGGPWYGLPNHPGGGHCYGCSYPSTGWHS